MSAKEYKTQTLVGEIRSRGIAVAGIDKDTVWWWSGQNWTRNKCRGWIEGNRNGLEDAMLKAAEFYFQKHRKE